MVCRIQKVGEHCLKLVVIKLCHRILQGIFNLHVGGVWRNRTFSNTNIFLSTSIFQDTAYLGKQVLWLNNFTGYQCFQRHRISWAVISRLPKSLQLYLLLACNVLGVSNFIQQHLCFGFCFVLVSPKTTSLLFLQYRWVWQHFRLNKHLSCQFKIWALCKVLFCQDFLSQL